MLGTSGIERVEVVTRGLVIRIFATEPKKSIDKVLPNSMRTIMKFHEV